MVLSPRVPKLASSVIAPTFSDLVESVPSLPPAYRFAADFDWAMHPGGATILSGAEKAMKISPEHMRASYDTYINHGNSSSATIFSVMDRLRHKDMDALAPEGRGPQEYVVGCAFGPGISVEMCMLKRNLRPRSGRGATNFTGLQTPPETESEGTGRSEAGADEEPGQETGFAPADQTSANVLDGRRRVEGFISEALERLDVD